MCSHYVSWTDFRKHVLSYSSNSNSIPQVYHNMWLTATFLLATIQASMIRFQTSHRRTHRCLSPLKQCSNALLTKSRLSRELKTCHALAYAFVLTRCGATIRRKPKRTPIVESTSYSYSNPVHTETARPSHPPLCTITWTSCWMQSLPTYPKGYVL